MKRLASLIAPAAGAVLLWSPLAAAAQPSPDVDPKVVQALQRMGAYVGSLTSFSIGASTTVDEVMENGQKVQTSGEVIYHVRRPNGFAIEVASDRQVRQFYYDGSDLTVFAPRSGLYASVPAPGNIGATLSWAYDRFGIALPLQDLFYWSDATLGRADRLKSAVNVGYAQIRGVDTDHYALREDGIDWQIWIRRGDKPLPVKVVIVSASEPAQPQYATNLTWSENAKFTDATFRFGKPKGAMPIELVEIKD